MTFPLHTPITGRACDCREGYFVGLTAPDMTAHSQPIKCLFCGYEGVLLFGSQHEERFGRAWNAARAGMKL